MWYELKVATNNEKCSISKTSVEVAHVNAVLDATIVRVSLKVYDENYIGFKQKFTLDGKI